MTPRLHPDPPARDSGSIAVFVLLVSTALAALLGLVAEGGQVLAARESATALAEQAARAGAARLDAASLRQGRIVDPGPGPVLAAERVMVAGGHPGRASRSGRVVTATVRPFEVRTPLLAIVGVGSIRVTASASAKAVAG